MIEETAMLRLIMEHAMPLPCIERPLDEALHHFCAKDISARLDAPAFDNSFFDGYAVGSEHAKGARLAVSGEQAAGIDRKLRVEEGACIRIFTGAPLPANTCAIIMQEDVQREEDHIVLKEDMKTGFGIRRRGMDVCKGQKILSCGERLTPPMLGLLASQGFAAVPTGQRPRLGLISTGNEIRRPGERLEPGEIYESHGVMLAALFHDAAAEPPEMRMVRDSPEAVREAIRGLEEKTDVLFLSGGMSVGAYDFAPRALEAEGFKVEAHRVRVKPGKPFLFGTRGRQLVFGFPGNPVAAYLMALLFARPALLKLAGGEESSLTLPSSPARLGMALQNPGNRPHYLRGNVAEGIFVPGGLQESHALFGLARANALLRIPENASFEAGDMVSVILLP